ncbi:MAG TPA: hypothetical protein PLI62_10125 [Spirochaetota bacterium]|nr:hypothetical protein [Spirochaetota bacterium]
MKIPVQIINKFEDETLSIKHGKIILEVHIRDSKPARYSIHIEQSLLPSDIGGEA